MDNLYNYLFKFFCILFADLNTFNIPATTPIKKKQIVKKKQNPEEIKEQIRQASEFEKKELFDPNQIAALIDKSKEETAETLKKNKKLTQSSVKTSFTNALTLNQEDALKAQIFGCWSLPLGLPYQENLLVRIKLRLKPDGTVLKSENHINSLGDCKKKY